MQYLKLHNGCESTYVTDVCSRFLSELLGRNPGFSKLHDPVYGRSCYRALPARGLEQMGTAKIRYGPRPYTYRKEYGSSRIRYGWQPRECPRIIPRYDPNAEALYSKVVLNPGCLHQKPDRSFVFTTMPSLAKHPFDWHYIHLWLMTGLMRLFAIPQQWRSRSRRLHEGVLFKIITVPSRDTGRDIQVHLYQPANRDNTKPTPVLVNWHGSVNYVGLLCCT